MRARPSRCRDKRPRRSSPQRLPRAARNSEVRVIRLTVMSSVLLLVGITASAADTLSTPIAVPLIGTQGPAGAYPSRQVVTARGGASQTGLIAVRLYGVTHPCPEDLAILLVHNNTDKFLLLSNAGGCRPFQGTDVAISPFGFAFPDTQAPTPPYGATLFLAPSNYGPAPVFAAPAPPGPYVLGLPPITTNINGTWDLYVFDTTADNRGVISGGWSLEYSTDVLITSPQTLVPLPGTGTVPGTAGAYPITFDLTGVPVGVDVTRVIVDVTMRHTFPDDVRLVLQSPSGTAVALMANAGGSVDIAPGTLLRFIDGGLLMADAGPIVATAYSPGQVFGGGSSIPAPGPALPHGLSFVEFVGEPVRGTWNLYAYDDVGVDVWTDHECQPAHRDRDPSQPATRAGPGDVDTALHPARGHRGRGRQPASRDVEGHQRPRRDILRRRPVPSGGWHQHLRCRRPAQSRHEHDYVSSGEHQRRVADHVDHRDRQRVHLLIGGGRHRRVLRHGPHAGESGGGAGPRGHRLPPPGRRHADLFRQRCRQHAPPARRGHHRPQWRDVDRRPLVRTPCRSPSSGR